MGKSKKSEQQMLSDSDTVPPQFPMTNIINCYDHNNEIEDHEDDDEKNLDFGSYENNNKKNQNLLHLEVENNNMMKQSSSRSMQTIRSSRDEKQNGLIIYRGNGDNHINSKNMRNYKSQSMHYYNDERRESKPILSSIDNNKSQIIMPLIKVNLQNAESPNLKKIKNNKSVKKFRKRHSHNSTPKRHKSTCKKLKKHKNNQKRASSSMITNNFVNDEKKGLVDRFKKVFE